MDKFFTPRTEILFGVLLLILAYLIFYYSVSPYLEAFSEHWGKILLRGYLALAFVCAGGALLLHGWANKKDAV